MNIGDVFKNLDANLVEKEINEGRIKVKKVSSLIEIPIELDKGEASTITLAKKLGIKEVLIDEASARTAAMMLELIPRGTLFVLLKALKLNKIDFDEFLKVLDNLLKEGFRLREGGLYSEGGILLRSVGGPEIIPKQRQKLRFS